MTKIRNTVMAIPVVNEITQIRVFGPGRAMLGKSDNGFIHRALLG